jgi:hypothetical protein
MRRRFFTSLTVAIAASFLIGTAQLTAQGSTRAAGLDVPFSTLGELNEVSAQITGTFRIARFAAQNGKLVAVGTVTAAAPDGAGVVRTAVTEVAVEVMNISSVSDAPTGVLLQQVSCGILHLELGPLDLDVLGLVVHLDKVVLDISAEPGSGNLLGNLLCQIAGLLDNGSPISQLLNQIVTLLNQIIAAL